MFLVPGAVVRIQEAQRNALESDVSAIPCHASLLFAWPSTETNPAAEASAGRLTEDLQTVPSSSYSDASDSANANLNWAMSFSHLKVGGTSGLWRE